MHPEYQIPAPESCPALLLQLLFDGRVGESLGDVAQDRCCAQLGACRRGLDHGFLGQIGSYLTRRRG